MKNYISVTQQQKEILKKLKDHNLIIETVAGCDKTSTVLLIAKYFKQLNILLLTCNSSLNEEVLKKASLLNIGNLKAHTFHSFALNYYDKQKSLTDDGLKGICDKRKMPFEKFKFDLIIVDQAEDITLLSYEFICKLISDNKNRVRICVMGEENQAINLDKEADKRYLSLADQLFDFNESKWARCSLSESIRLNDKMVNFVNKVFYQKDLITTNEVNDYLPEFFITDTSEEVDLSNKYSLYNKIKYEAETWSAENVVVLASTLKNDHLSKIANQLINEDKINLYFLDENESIDRNKINGKLVFSTFKQAKNLERKVAIVFGFDDSYFTNIDNELTNILPNDLYIAVTCASKRLVLVQHYKNNILSFLNIEKLQKHCKFYYGLNKYKMSIFKQNLKNLTANKPDNHIKSQFDKNKNISVTKIVSQVPQNILDTCMSLLECSELESELDFVPLQLPTSIENDPGNFQNVSAINGVAIPLYFQWGCKSSLDYSNIWISLGNNNDSHLNQINENNYNWIDRDQLNRLAGLMSEYISEDSLHEQKYSLSEETELHNKILTGYIDCIDHKRNTVWEFKCTKTFSDNHYLQLAIYAYLFETQRKLELERHEKMGVYNIENVKINDTIEFKEINEYYNGKVVGKYPLGFKVEVSKTEIKWVKYEYFLKKLNYGNELIQTEKQLKQKYNFLLFNILKNEIHKVSCKYENLKKIVDLLVKSKYFESLNKTETDFLKENNTIKLKYSNFNK